MSKANSKDSRVRSSATQPEQLLRAGDIHTSKNNWLIEIIETLKESKEIAPQIFGYQRSFLSFHLIMTSQLTFAVNKKKLLQEDHGNK